MHKFQTRHKDKADDCGINLLKHYIMVAESYIILWSTLYGHV